jgi:hypothetical protein
MYKLPASLKQDLLLILQNAKTDFSFSQIWAIIKQVTELEEIKDKPITK